MSATMGDTTFFEEELTRLTGRPTIAITSTTASAAGAMNIPNCRCQDARKPGRFRPAPVYVVHFTQLEAAQSAQEFHEHQCLHPR